ncbi:hypothetical protein [Melittangium boletus]|uniref:Lipoprotein n=1 Tax=Melittangium boletus DSM 14713 TaxID=1294270 RepID=A0A250IHH1_9BACT|nr:hypothetical protein [Melittangium boletus]ATB30673.1 hypothetical protein MEBOL_004134 [Melittangium boletus DSM 14713]
MKISKWSVPWMLLTASVLVTGCAASRREMYIQEKASDYVYRKPIAEVWPEVRAMLKEKELPVREAPGGYEISTDWHQLGASSNLGTSYVRYLVRGHQPSPAMTQVEILRQNRVESGQGAMATPNNRTAGTDSVSRTRDREMEWELLQRVDPEGAKALKAEAEATIK